jgi:hypothetical protein
MFALCPRGLLNGRPRAPGIARESEILLRSGLNTRVRALTAERFDGDVWRGQGDAP